MVCGPFGFVRFAKVADGTYPAEVIWNGQKDAWKAKFASLFQYITSNRELQLHNRTQFKKLDGDLFEFKRNDVKSRLFAFRHRNSWYLVHGITTKKEDDLPARDVALATKYVAEAKALLERSTERRS